MSTFSDAFNDYHLNSYLLSLYQGDQNISPGFRLHLKNILTQRHLVDHRLNRYDQMVKNVEYKNFLRDLSDDPNTESFDWRFSDVFPDKYSITNAIKNNISDINSPRLDMVWSRTLVEVFLSCHNISSPHLTSLLRFIALVNGFASYGLYVIRGGVDFAMGTKGVLGINEPDVTLNDQFKFQLRQRYFRITNDLLLWAPVNYLSFHILVGQLAFYGNLITAILLAGDLMLSMVNVIVKEYELKEICERERARLKSANFPDVAIEAHINDITQRHSKALRLDYSFMIYQLLLICGFVLLWSPWSSSMTFVMAGAITCFVLQLLVNQIESLIKLSDYTEDYQKYQEYCKMLGRFTIQLAIPAVFIVSALYLMPLFPGVTPAFFFMACLGIDVALSKLINDTVKIASDEIEFQYRAGL